MIRRKPGKDSKHKDNKSTTLDEQFGEIWIKKQNEN